MAGVFQFTRPRGARHGARLVDRHGLVSIHAPAWGATRLVRDAQDGPGFNSRARVGRDLRRAEPLRRLLGVSIHAPAWGATRGRRDRDARDAVSIHAPAWGATVMDLLPTHAELLFQFTRPRGARRKSVGRLLDPRRFNSRARVGRDPVGIVVGSSSAVSIHAPAWGATLRTCRPSQSRPVSIHAPAWGATNAPATTRAKAPFQFTRPRGARQQHQDISGKLDAFQFTRPRGARPTWTPPRTPCTCFNSRARVGRDVGPPRSA